MKYRVRCLTPVLVGNGDQLAPIDYMVWRDQINVLNQYRIFRLLAKGPRLEGYLKQIKAANRLDFASWGGFAQNFSLRRVAFEDPSLTPIWEKAGRDSLFIPTFARNHLGPYLPGTALKGALRTAVLYSRWRHGLPAEIQQILNSGNFLRRVTEPAEAREIGRAGSALMRFLVISDSTPISDSDLRVFLVRTATLDQTGRGTLQLFWKVSPKGKVDPSRVDESTPRFVEMAPAGTTFEGPWKENHLLLQNPLILEEAGLSEPPKRTLFLRAANEYAAQLLALHRRYAEAAGLSQVVETIRQLQDQLTAIWDRADACMLNIGWGGGILSKTVWTSSNEGIYRQILRQIPQYAKTLNAGLPFPKTRNVVFEKGEPRTLPGWVLLEILD